ncbi:MAG: hypothetical protein L6V91_09795 [Bacilli bacterium]|nr:MAG: hypothetical protein L6V91_09795 [Bacilli bacterium]
MDIYNIDKNNQYYERKTIKTRFISKGKKIIDINNKVVDNSLNYLNKNKYRFIMD